jgi:hypothetical protein
MSWGKQAEVGTYLLQGEVGVVEEKRIMTVAEYSRAGARTGRTVRICEVFS